MDKANHGPQQQLKHQPICTHCSHRSYCVYSNLLSCVLYCGHFFFFYFFLHAAAARLQKTTLANIASADNVNRPRNSNTSTSSTSTSTSVAAVAACCGAYVRIYFIFFTFFLFLEVNGGSTALLLRWVWCNCFQANEHNRQQQCEHSPRASALAAPSIGAIVCVLLYVLVCTLPRYCMFYCTTNSMLRDGDIFLFRTTRSAKSQNREIVSGDTPNN